jgi:hypothetical protein
LSLSTLGTLHEPRAWLVYDYSNFDPEDELYGEFERGDVERLEDTFTFYSQCLNADPMDDDADDDDEADTWLAAAGASSTDRYADVADSVQVPTAPIRAGAFAELGELLRDNPSIGKSDLNPELRRRLGRELRRGGPAAILSAGVDVVAAVRKTPSILPRWARRHLIKTLELTPTAPSATWCGVKILLDDPRFSDTAFLHFWHSDLTDEVRSQLVLWAFEAGVARVRAGNIVAAALTALTRVGPRSTADPKMAKMVFAYLEAIAPNVGVVQWMPCFLSWAMRVPHHVRDRSSTLWQALSTWWRTNEHLLRPEHFDPLILERSVPKRLRSWATSRKVRALLRQCARQALGNAST